MDIAVIEFQMEFSSLNKKLFDTDPMQYDICVLMLRAMMLKEKHVKMVKKYKPNRKGTKVNFAPVKDLDEYTEEANRIVEKAKKIKQSREGEKK